jgi:hypothetical protein
MKCNCTALACNCTATAAILQGFAYTAKGAIFADFTPKLHHLEIRKDVQLAH